MVTVYKPELVGYTLSYYVKDLIPKNACTVRKCDNGWYHITAKYTGIISEAAVYKQIVKDTQADPLNFTMTIARWRYP